MMTTNEDHDRSCLCCIHLEIDFGVPDYSEETPGNSASLSCKKDHYSYETVYGSDVRQDELLDKAKECKDFEHR